MFCAAGIQHRLWKMGKADLKVLAALAFHRNPQTGQCNPRITLLMSDTGLTRKSVGAALDRLEAWKFIRRTRQCRDNGSETSSQYDLAMIGLDGTSDLGPVPPMAVKPPKVAARAGKGAKSKGNRTLSLTPAEEELVCIDLRNRLIWLLHGIKHLNKTDAEFAMLPYTSRSWCKYSKNSTVLDAELSVPALAAYADFKICEARVALHEPLIPPNLPRLCGILTFLLGEDTPTALVLERIDTITENWAQIAAELTYLEDPVVLDAPVLLHHAVTTAAARIAREKSTGPAGPPRYVPTPSSTVNIPF
jgi:hypothetical protein